MPKQVESEKRKLYTNLDIKKFLNIQEKITNTKDK